MESQRRVETAKIFAAWTVAWSLILMGICLDAAWSYPGARRYSCGLVVRQSGSACGALGRAEAPSPPVLGKPEGEKGRG